MPTLPPEQTGSSGAEYREDRLLSRVFLSPTVVILLILAIFPLIFSLGISFTDLQRGAQASGAIAAEGQSTFLGLGFNFTLQNYINIFSDERLHATLRNTLVYVLVGITVQYVIGLGLAVLLNQEFFGRRFFRVVFLLPMMITPVAAAWTGRMMFDPTFSPLAQLLRTVASFIGSITGQETRIVVNWLSDSGLAPFTMVLIDSWQWIPFMTLLLLAGLQSIPDEIYEAARVDGANAPAMFWRITMPLLLPISITAILIRGLEIFKIADIIRVTTGGGPGWSTESLVMYVFDTSLTFGNFGYAAAIAYVLLVMVIAFTTFFLALSRRLVRQQTGVG
jgi:multiple sugar transport system permease protein